MVWLEVLGELVSFSLQDLSERTVTELLDVSTEADGSKSEEED
jgi:hypothetical protein